MPILHANLLLPLSAAFRKPGDVAHKAVLGHLDAMSAWGLRRPIGDLLLAASASEGPPPVRGRA